MALKQIEAERLRIKEKVPTAIALYFLKKGHTQAGSPVRGPFKASAPWPP